MSKRTASDQELALPSPEAKKACQQKSQDDMPSDTPFDDDLDDLYADSSAVPQHPQEAISPPVVVAAPQYSLSDLQHSNVQLPGSNAAIEGAASSSTQPGPSQMSTESAINITAPLGGTGVPIVRSKIQGKEVQTSGNATRHASQDQHPEQSEMMDTTPDVSGLPVEGQKIPESNRQEILELSAAASNTKSLPYEDTPASAAPKIPEKTQTMKEEPGNLSNEVEEASKNNDEAEFELDSSPIEASSEEESDSSTSSSGDSDYEMLDPEEEARRLMQEDGGSDDEIKGGKFAAEPPRTLNEKPEEIIPKPQIDVTPAMSILELGNVEHIVEASILIKATNSGESRALETGSLLCLADRSVIGVIAEILGQVQQPYYSVRFTNAAAIAETRISKGTPIFYVEQHSTYVFTQNLKALKGSDASNIHDEEVGDDEMEFSDDEAEAEYKRRVKQEKLARKGGRGGSENGFSKPSRGARGGRRGGYSNLSFDARNGAESPPINYDDYDDGDGLYTPLARPSNLHEWMGRGEAPQEDFNSRMPNGMADQTEAEIEEEGEVTVVAEAVDAEEEEETEEPEEGSNKILDMKTGITTPSAAAAAARITFASPSRPLPFFPFSGLQRIPASSTTTIIHMAHTHTLAP
ncbi:MAG: hypothetical protein Q9212_007018 [Teloschistes hypoglaucus]